MRGNGYAGVPATGPGVVPRTVFPDPVDVVAGSDSDDWGCDGGEVSSWMGETRAGAGMAGCPPLTGISLFSIWRANCSRYSFSCRCASLKSGSAGLSISPRPSSAPGDAGPARFDGFSSPSGKPEGLAGDVAVGTLSGPRSPSNEMDFLAGVWEAGPGASGGCGPLELAGPPVICPFAVRDDDPGTVTTSLAAGQFDGGCARSRSLSADSGSATLIRRGGGELLPDLGTDSQSRTRIPHRASRRSQSAVQPGDWDRVRIQCERRDQNERWGKSRDGKDS